MSNVKPSSKRKRRSKALPVMGAAGLTLSLANSAYAMPSSPAAVPTQNTWDKQDLAIGEEEIADVSLATFYVLDKEHDGSLPGLQLIRHGCGGGCGCGGCRHFGGCGGCRHACGGCGGCRHGCGGCRHGCGGGCGCVGLFWGGCGGGCGGCASGYWCWINGRRVWCTDW
jgi:hypothetical protein